MGEDTKKRLLGKLFGRKEKEEKSEAAKAKTKPGKREPRKPGKTVKKKETSTKRESEKPTSAAAELDAVELEMDIPEDEIATVTLSVSDLEGIGGDEDEEDEATREATEVIKKAFPQDRASDGVELETIDTTTEIKMDRGAQQSLSEGAGTAEIPSPDEEDTTSPLYPAKSRAPEKKEAGPREDEEDDDDVDIELDMSDDEDEEPLVEKVADEAPPKTGPSAESEPAAPASERAAEEVEEAAPVAIASAEIEAETPVREQPAEEPEEVEAVASASAESEPAALASERAGEEVEEAAPVAIPSSPSEPIPPAPEQAPEESDEAAAVTSGEVATRYGFPEYVSAEQVAATGASDAVSEAASDMARQTQVLAPTGLADVPLSDAGQQKGLSEIDAHAVALADFLLHCQTPMRISIHGEAGSGKTSLMRLVAAHVDSSDVIPIWFNAWDHSRFNYAPQLPLLYVAHFVNELCRRIPDNQAKKLTEAREQALRRLKKAAWVGLLSSEADSVPIDVDMLTESIASGGIVDSLHGLQRVLEHVVKESLERSPSGRIVAFVDDLERLEPPKALEFLEAIRVFLSVEGCAFVVTCEPETIADAAGALLYGDGPEGSGRSYVEKMFQLSVGMPSDQKGLREYLRTLLGVAPFDGSGVALNDYLRLLRFSVGFNPRKIKRIANKLAFFNALRPDAIVSVEASWDAWKKQKVLFGVGCLESEFPRVFHLLLSVLHDEKEFFRLIEEQLGDREPVQDLDSTRDLLGDVPNREETLEKLIDFVDVLRDILHRGDEGRALGAEGMHLLREAVSLVSVTGAHRAYLIDDSAPQSALTEFCRRVRSRVQDALGKVAPDRSDKSIRGWTSERPWFRLWYSRDAAKKLWGPGRVSYELSFDAKNRNVLAVSLKCSTERLRELGVKKEELQRLETMPGLDAKGFQYKDHGTGLVEIVKILQECTCNSIHELKDEEIEHVADQLKSLIEQTHNLFDIAPKVTEPPAGTGKAPQPKIPCKVCKSPMAPVKMKDGSVGYKCETCRKVYKVKGLPKSGRQA